jgi:hypothetical protein
MIDVLLLSDAITSAEWENIENKLSIQDKEILENAIVRVAEYYRHCGYEDAFEEGKR